MSHAGTGKGPVKVPLYAVTIHNCVGRGDLAEMQALVNEAELQLEEHGNIAAALAALKSEITKLEAR